MSTVQPQQAVILIPVDEFLHMKEELISEVRSLGVGNVVPTGSSMKEVMTPQEAAEVLNISVKHLMELRRAKKIACSEDGRRIRFHRSHILGYLDNHTKHTK